MGGGLEAVSHHVYLYKDPRQVLEYREDRCRRRRSLRRRKEGRGGDLIQAVERESLVCAARAATLPRRRTGRGAGSSAGWGRAAPGLRRPALHPPRPP